MKPRAPAESASADSSENMSHEGLTGAINDNTPQQRGNNFGNNEVQLKATNDSRRQLRLPA